MLPIVPASSNVQLLAAAQEVRLAGNLGWLHESSIWIMAPEAAELHFHLPANIEQMSVLVDRRVHSAWNRSARELALPLDASPLPRLIQVRCLYAKGTESLAAPSLAPITLDQAKMPTPQRILWIPPDAFLAGADGNASSALVERLLHQATTHMRIAAALAQESAVGSTEVQKQLLARQRSFFSCLRQVDYLLPLVKLMLDTDNGSERSARVKAAKRRGWRKSRRYEEAKQAAERAEKSALLSASEDENGDVGLPWSMPGHDTNVTLQSMESRSAAQVRTRTEWILLLAVCVLVLSYFRHGVSMLRLLAPEAAAALVLLATWRYGPGALGATLLACAILLRLLWIIKAVRHRLQLHSTDFETAHLAPTKSQLPPHAPPK